MKDKIIRIVTFPPTVYYVGLAIVASGAAWVYPPAGVIVLGGGFIFDSLYTPRPAQ